MIVRLPRFFSPELDEAVDLGHDRGILRPARFEELGDARQTAGDVLRAAASRAVFASSSPGRSLAVLDLDVGALGDRVQRERPAVLSSSTSCGCRSPLCSMTCLRTVPRRASRSS
jgi:hypothetical protein